MKHTTGNRLAGLLFAVAALMATDALGHGTMEVPESRIYNCFLNNPENPSDPAYAAAKAVGGTQPFYDWNEINQGNAAGNHRALVSDGQLCGGGRSKYAGMDLARDDWQEPRSRPRQTVVSILFFGVQRLTPLTSGCFTLPAVATPARNR